MHGIKRVLINFLMHEEEIERELMVSHNKVNFRDLSVPRDWLMRHLSLFQEKYYDRKQLQPPSL